MARHRDKVGRSVTNGPGTGDYDCWGCNYTGYWSTLLSHLPHRPQSNLGIAPELFNRVGRHCHEEMFDNLTYNLSCCHRFLVLLG